MNCRESFTSLNKTKSLLVHIVYILFSRKAYMNLVLGSQVVTLFLFVPPELSSEILNIRSLD